MALLILLAVFQAANAMNSTGAATSSRSIIPTTPVDTSGGGDVEAGVDFDDVITHIVMERTLQYLANNNPHDVQAAVSHAARTIMHQCFVLCHSPLFQLLVTHKQITVLEEQNRKRKRHEYDMARAAKKRRYDLQRRHEHRTRKNAEWRRRELPVPVGAPIAYAPE